MTNAGEAMTRQDTMVGMDLDFTAGTVLDTMVGMDLDFTDLDCMVLGCTDLRTTPILITEVIRHCMPGTC
jgi:hypothetical protein